MEFLGKIFGKKREEPRAKLVVPDHGQRIGKLESKLCELESELRELRMAEPPKPIPVHAKLEEVLLTEFDPSWPQLKRELLRQWQERMALPSDLCEISERGIVARAKISPKKKDAGFEAGDGEIILVRGAKIFRAGAEGYCEFWVLSRRVARFRVDSSGVAVFPRPVIVNELAPFELRGDGKLRADIGLIGAKATRRWGY